MLLAVTLALVLFLGRGGALATAPYYWFAIAIVRTAETVIGDLIAENHQFNLGLSASTVFTGLLFVVTVVFREVLIPTKQGPCPE